MKYLGPRPLNMISEDRFKEGLRTAKEYVGRVGGEVVGYNEVEGEADGYEVQGHACRHGDHNYVVIGTRDWEFFYVRYTVNLDQVYAVSQEVSDMGRTTGEVQVELTPEKLENAKEALDDELGGMDRDTLMEARSKVIELITRNGSTGGLDETRPGHIHGFNVDGKVFLYDDDYRPADFERVVQTAINNGWAANNYVQGVYGVSGLQGSVGNVGPDDKSFI